jgi:peptidoglycan hydrolase CwlO-like protein
MKYILSTFAVCVLFLTSCKNDISNKKDEVAANSPNYQDMKKSEAVADKAMPDLVMYQKAMRELLHSMEKANQTFDSTSMNIRRHLSELNKAENALANYKTSFSARMDTMAESRRAVYSAYGKQESETARDMVLYSVEQTKKLVQKLRDLGIQVPFVPEH